MHKHHGGLFEFPGGKLQKGESLTEAAERELREELGVALRELGPVCMSALDSAGEFLIHFAPATIVGEPQPIEHDELRWATIIELRMLPLAPSDRQFVDTLIPN